MSVPSVPTLSERTGLACALSLYLLIAVAILDRGLIHCTSCYIGRDTDPPMFMWFLRWWPYAIAHRLNPFWTDRLWAPRGFNLAWTTIVPLPALASIPLQWLFGLRIAYNVLCTVAVATAAAAGFALCRRITREFWPSLVGGALFGFSPYMLGQSLAHLHALAVFPVPLVALAALKRVEAEVSTRRYIVTLVGLLVAQFLCSIEIFATLAIVAGIALVLALIVFRADQRARIAGLIVPTAAAGLITAVILSPYLYFLLALGFPHGPIWTPDRYAADVVNLVVPTGLNWLGTLPLALAITRHFRGTIFENGAYLGIVLILIVERFRRHRWSTPAGKLLTLLLLAIVTMALGPSLHIVGRQTFVMPWAAVAKMPLVSSALPVRFMMYAFMVCGVMSAMWLATTPACVTTRWAAGAALAISLFPNPHAGFWVDSLDKVPAFFMTPAYSAQLAPNEIVLPLPFGQRGNSMYWQAQTGMYFRMAGGWTGVTPFEFERMPAINFFYGANDLPEAADQVKAYLARFEVRAILADPRDRRVAALRPLLDSLDMAHFEIGGLWIYRIAPNAFAAYRGLTGAYLEERATTRRFDAILAGVASYLAAGHDPEKLSPLSLKQFDLLPRDWSIDTAPDAYPDWNTSRLKTGNFAILVKASYGAAAPLIERYYRGATGVMYPAPTRWRPDSRPVRDVISPLLIIFDRDQVTAAARQLLDSPPPELTTPFATSPPTVH